MYVRLKCHWTQQYGCDDIICDYNYLFDPKCIFKTIFQEGIKGDYIFLVDEAHNLVERSRSMYSAGYTRKIFKHKENN